MNITDELIEQYLAGEPLDELTLKAIDAKLRNDETYSNAIATKLQDLPPEDAILHAIKKTGNAELKKKVETQVNLAAAELKAEGFFETVSGEKSDTEMTPKQGMTVTHRRSPIQILLAVAAVFLAVIVAYKFVESKIFNPSEAQISSWFSNNSGEKIATEINDQFKNLGATGSDGYEMLLKALEKYNTGEYAAAKASLEQIVKLYPEIKEAPFFLAMCQLKIGDFSNAKTGFEQIKSGEFVDAARFHLAETLLRMGNKKEARIVLSTVAGKRGEFQRKAQDILDKW